MKISLPKLYRNKRYDKPNEIEKITINQKSETNSKEQLFVWILQYTSYTVVVTVSKCVNYRTIVADNEAESERQKLIKNFQSTKKTKEARPNDSDFQDTDDTDIPPLI